jgi:hypothetical protein
LGFLSWCQHGWVLVGVNYFLVKFRHFSTKKLGNFWIFFFKCKFNQFGLESLLSIVSCVNRDFTTELSNRVGFKPMESWLGWLCWQIVPSSRYLVSPCVNRDRWVIGHFLVPNFFHFATKKKGLPRLLYVGFFGAKMSPYF